MGMKLVGLKDKQWEEQLPEEKKKELVEKAIDGLDDLIGDLQYFETDFDHIIDKLQLAKNAFEEYDDENNDEVDNRREVPWYLEQEHDILDRMIVGLEEKRKEIEEYRKEAERLLKFTELVKNRLNNEFNVEDAEGLVDVAFNYGHITVFYGNSTVLAEASITSDIKIKDLIASAFTLANIKNIIMGSLVNTSLEEGKDTYEGKVDEIRDYIANELKEILE